MAEITYKCESCGKEIKKEKEEKTPICCGEEMKQLPLDVCLYPNNPEAARTDRDDEPCDQGRGG